MKRSNKFLPEGSLISTPQNASLISTLQGLQKAAEENITLEAMAVLCDSERNLVVNLNGLQGIIPKNECALGIKTGETRDIAIISRVGKAVCFKVDSIDSSTLPPTIKLSRARAQQEAVEHFVTEYSCGDIIPARVTHLESFGAFVDIGCGVISLIGIENISVSRIFHPRERFYEGQNIFAVILDIDRVKNRLTLTHRELLGTWEQNAQGFSCGETVRGIVRSIEDYGIFIELTPNLSGLAEHRFDVKNGQNVAVYIKSIIPQRMKIKLSIINAFDDIPITPSPFDYFITDGHMDTWIYTPSTCENKYIATSFEDKK